MTDRKIAIIGVGPVGGILAAHLIEHGKDVTLIDVFREHVDKMRSDALVIEGTVPRKVPVASAFLGVAEAALAGARFDTVFICVKATAIRNFIEYLPRVLTDGGVAISFQNGMDTEASVLEILGPERTLRGVVNYAGNLASVGRIQMTFFNPPNYMGAAAPGNSAAEERAKEVAVMMSDTGLATIFSDNILWHVWEKVIRNAGMMPISALTGMDIAQVSASEHGSFVVKKLLEESIAVSRAAGYSFDDSFFDETLDYYEKAGHHVPSMLEDVRDGRRTEIEFLNRRIAEYGERHGVETPYSRAVSRLILCIDELNAQRQRKSD